MGVVVMEQEAFDQMLTEFKNSIEQSVDKAKQEILINIEAKNQHEWCGQKEAMEILGVKTSKLQELRDHLEIEFSQHGRTIRYNVVSLYQFLEKNVVKH